MSEEKQLQNELGSFEYEIEKYKPKDMIDFSIEYFKSLQAGSKLEYKDLSGLEKFELKPEDREIVNRLGIPQEDLMRVLNRRKVQSKEEIYKKLQSEIEKYSKIDPANEEEMKKYLKFKKNSFKNYEFIRFIDGIENVNVITDENRIYFTKLFNLNTDEKRIVFNLLECDWALLKNPKIREWKFSLERLDNAQKHTYHSYDNISNKLEDFIHQLDNKEKINIAEAEEIFKPYEQKYYDTIDRFREEDLYTFLLSLSQFERLILYDIVKIRYLTGRKNFYQGLYDRIDSVYNKHFAHLTKFDFYNYILCCFIPFIKASDKTSNVHREMESFLNKFLSEIPNIININFYEEKKLYYNIECVKYFLHKENKVLQSKQILIDIIKMFSQQVSYLTKNLKVQLKFLKPEFELVVLKLNEFYKDKLLFIHKVIDIFSRHKLEDSEDILNSLISQYKSYSTDDQKLITVSLVLFSLFEGDKSKKEKFDTITNIFLQALSVPEQSFAIIKTAQSLDNLVSLYSQRFYMSAMKDPRFNFETLHYIPFKSQSEVISLIIKNNPNIRNLALLYQKEHITPFVDYEFMVEEMYNFTNLFFKLRFEKDMIEKIEKDGNELLSRCQEKFKKEFDYVRNDNKYKINNNYVEQFKDYNYYQQKLILSCMCFIDNFNLTDIYTSLIDKLSYIFLVDKVKYIKAKIFKEKNIEKNQIFIDFLYTELKRVNFKMFIFLKYDHSIDFLSTFPLELQSLMQDIMQLEKCDSSITIPNVIPIQDLIKETDMTVIDAQLQENYQLMNDFILDYNFQQPEDLITDFDIFPIEYKKFIVFYLEKVRQNVTPLKEAIEKNHDDLGIFDYKKIINCESDVDATDEIKRFYRKKLLEIEKKLSTSKINFISCILDYPYDPNNNYLYKNFLSFYQKEKIVILQDILSRMKVLNYHTLYYDNLVCQVMPDVIREQIGIANRHKESIVYSEYLQKEFLYLLSFFNDSLLKFVKDLNVADNQTIFKFTTEFTDKEREMLVHFIELMSVLLKNGKYLTIKEELDNYLKDLTYEERTKDINEKLDRVINNEVHKDLFIVVAEEIKETYLEVDYLVENVIANVANSDVDIEEDNNSLIFMIYKSLTVSQRDIVDKVLQCIKEFAYQPKMKKYQDEFALMKNSEQGQSLFVTVIKSFQSIKEKATSVEGEEKEKLKEQYAKLKEVLKDICGDLFVFCDKCRNNEVSLRKLKAISKEKIDIIKLILEIEFLLFREPNIKSSYDYIKQIKFE